MDNLIKLHSKGQIPTDSFGSYFTPVNEQLKQIENTIIKTETHINFLKMQQLDGDSILENTSNLYDQWPLLDDVAKRNVI